MPLLFDTDTFQDEDAGPVPPYGGGQANDAPLPEERGEYALARSLFLRAKVDADTTFADDADHGSWVPRYRQQLGQVQQGIAEGIASAPVRARFNNQSALDIAQGASDLADKSQARTAEEGRAQLTGLIAANREAALRSGDPQTREGLINVTIDGINAARSSGLFTAVEAQEAREGFVRNYELDRDDRFSVALQTDLGTAGEALTQDPSKFATVQAEMMQRIETSGLTDDRKAELRRKVNGSLAQDALQGQIAVAPVQAKTDLATGTWDGYIDADQKAVALDAADMQIARDADRLEQQRRQASQGAEDKIVRQISTGDRSLSAMTIAQDAALSPDKQREMIGVLRQSTQPDPPVAVSRAATVDLYKRIYAGDADPLKLRDSSAINQAFAGGSLTRADFYRLRQELADAQTPDGAALGRRKAIYLQTVEPLIDKSDPQLGIVDEAGRQKFYDYLSTVDRAVARFRKDGEDPYDLFDPSKPDYLGKPAALEPYQTSLEEISTGGAVSQGERRPIESIMDRDPIAEADRAGLPRRKVNAFLNRKWDQARTAGYSDEEIESYLASTGDGKPERPSLDSIYKRHTTSEARLAGYSDEEIRAYHLNKMKGEWQRVGAEAVKGAKEGFGDDRLRGGRGELIRRLYNALAEGGTKAARQAALEAGASEEVADWIEFGAHLALGKK